MSLITHNAKEYRTMGGGGGVGRRGRFQSLSHLNRHLVLVGANNRNVIITYRLLAAPVQLTIYFNCKYIRASYLSASSGFIFSLLLGKIPAGTIIDLAWTFQPAWKWRVRREKHLQSLDPRLPNKRNKSRTQYQWLNGFTDRSNSWKEKGWWWCLELAGPIIYGYLWLGR